MIASFGKSIITQYQKRLSPLLGYRCRFYPSCSSYAHDCLDKYPFPKASARIVWRLLRCQPWHPGGIDLP